MNQFLSRLAFLVTAFALGVGGYCLQPESPRELPPPEPTPPEVIARVEALGGQYQLNRYGQVDQLNLKCLPISDDDLKILYDLPELKSLNLRGINVHGGDHFTDEGLRHVGALQKLESLNLTANRLLTDQGTRYLVTCPELKKLLSPAGFQGRTALEHLSRMPQLDYLLIGRTQLDEETLPYFQQMTLEALHGIDVSQENLHLLAELPTLTLPPFSSDREIRDVDLKYVSHLYCYSRLNIVLTKGWGDTSELKYLASMPNLSEISIYEPGFRYGRQIHEGPIDLEGFQTLARLPKLKELNLPLGDRFLKLQAMCPQIERVFLKSNEGQLTPGGLEILQQFPNLKKVEIHENLVCDQSLDMISRIPSLKVLTLTRSFEYRQTLRSGKVAECPANLSDNGLQHLARLSELKSLNLPDWGIDNRMLAVIGQLTSLESLWLGGSRVTETGIMQLRHLQHLKYLDLTGGTGEISRDVCLQLHSYMPECRIQDLWCCGCLSIEPGEI